MRAIRDLELAVPRQRRAERKQVAVVALVQREKILEAPVVRVADLRREARRGQVRAGEFEHPSDGVRGFSRKLDLVAPE